MKNLVRIISFILCCCTFSSCTNNSVNYTICKEPVDQFDFTKEGLQVGYIVCGRDTHQYALFKRHGISSFAHWESCKYCSKEEIIKKDEKIIGKADTCKRSR